MPRRRKRRRLPFAISSTVVGICTVLVLLLVGLATHPVVTLLLVAVVVAVGAYLWRWSRRRRRLRATTLGELLALTPPQFEQAVGDLLHDMGYRQVRRVGGPGDLAADLRCSDPKGRSVVVQCKRYAPGHRVGSGDIQAFIGMVQVHHRAERGIFVTTSEFTRPATELARMHGVDLFDGQLLTRLMVELHRPVVERELPAW